MRIKHKDHTKEYAQHRIQPNWAEQVNPVDYVATHWRGDVVTIADHRKLLRTIQKENRAYLNRALDSEGNATAYVLAPEKWVESLAEVARRPDVANRAVEAWDGVALHYALRQAKAAGRVSDKTEVIELRLHQPMPDEKGLLRWDGDPATTEVTGIYGLNQIDDLVEKAQLHGGLDHLLGATALTA